ncbi:hypothetical protein [Pectinatus sottacetonis]|uniref:hypothetical protein n=1 Tax=Pectinatus sottacetonis TaxID=1002795 RepID=UPI0018C551F2|nr:hypothetical protein [Pectinatus sottacetonis]
MNKIPKNLSDKDMFKEYKEEKKNRSLFDIANEFDKHMSRENKNNVQQDQGYINKELADRLEKELLKLKLDLYKEDIVDYKIKVHREGKNIILTPVVKSKYKS